MPYLCSNCQRSFPNFQLSCPDCGSWNSLKLQSSHIAHEDARPVALPDIGSFVIPRIRTKVAQLDELLGDGFVPGSSVLLIGPPGAGKSTLLMQVLKKMNIDSLYVTGEESIQQLKLRADRLKINSHNIFLLFEMNVNKISAHVRHTPTKVLVIDSIQTMYTEASDTLPGSSTQIRKCAYILRRLAQEKSFVLIVVGQVTKDKKAAGPKLLEHAVDVVLYLEVDEGKSAKDNQHHRLLFASKNRFGSTTPRCQLLMRKTGLVFHDAGSSI
jgi:DNA repair protein RadA/Sms